MMTYMKHHVRFFPAGGVILILSIVFMAVTSAGSAEFIAMSSLFTYDVYKTYIRPKAKGEELLYVSQAAVLIIGLAMGLFSCFIYKVGIDVNFLFLVMGLMVSSTVPPLTFMLIWPAVPRGAAICSAIGGQICAITAWLLHAQIVYHRLTVSDTLQRLGPTLTGSVVSLVASFVICTCWTLLFPDKTDSYMRFKDIQAIDEAVDTPSTEESVNIDEALDTPLTEESVNIHEALDTPSTEESLNIYEALDTPSNEESVNMDASFRRSSFIALALTVLLVVVWPLLTVPAGVFSEGYFGLWVVISIVWAIAATIICTLLPLIESRQIICKVLEAIFLCERSQKVSTETPCSPHHWTVVKTIRNRFAKS